MNSATELLDLAAFAYLRDGVLGLTGLQREMRRSVIGGSDAGAIVAGGKEWVELWAQKTGRSEGEDLSRVLAVQMGHWTEALNRCWYQMQTGRKVERVSEYCHHPTLEYLAVNLDGMSTTEGGHPCAWQAKHVGASGDRLTLRYTAQCTHEALCLGVDWWAMSAFISNSRWELTEQEVDPLFAAEYLARCHEFWWYVKSDNEPPDHIPPLGVPAPAKPLITIDFTGVTYGTPEWGEKVACYNWAPRMIEEMLCYADTLAAFRAHMASKDRIKSLLPEHVGTVIRGRVKVAKDRAGAVRVSMSKNGGNDE